MSDDKVLLSISLLAITVIISSRLNSAPLGEFSGDVGKRTTLRMSYPESTPFLWEDQDPDTLYVAVAYKGADLSWISAMIKKQTVVSPHQNLWHSSFRLDACRQPHEFCHSQ